MPIVSRSLTKLANREDIAPGMKKWRIEGVDTKGRAWAHRPVSAMLVAEAEVLRDSVVWDLQRNEETEVVQWIEDGNNPDTYPREEMTLNEFRRRLAKRVANLPFQGNEKFFCNIASWVLGFTATQIANVLGVTQTKAQKILDRASRLDTTICPALTLDEGDIQGDV